MILLLLEDPKRFKLFPSQLLPLLESVGVYPLELRKFSPLDHRALISLYRKLVGRTSVSEFIYMTNLRHN